MGDLVKTKEGETSKAAEMAEAIKGKKSQNRNIAHKFVRTFTSRSDALQNDEFEEPRKSLKNIEEVRLRSAITQRRKLRSNMNTSSARNIEATTRAGTSYENLKTGKLGTSTS